MPNDKSAKNGSFTHLGSYKCTRSCRTLSKNQSIPKHLRLWKKSATTQHLAQMATKKYIAWPFSAKIITLSLHEILPCMVNVFLKYQYNCNFPKISSKRLHLFYWIPNEIFLIIELSWNNNLPGDSIKDTWNQPDHDYSITYS